MKDFEVNIIQYCKPILIKASSAEEVREIVDKKMSKHNNNYSQIKDIEIRIRDKDQHWFRAFIDNNF